MTEIQLLGERYVLEPEIRKAEHLHNLMKRPCRNAAQTSIIKTWELHLIPLKTLNFN